MTLRERVTRAFRAGGWRALWFGVLGATVYRRLLVLERRLDAPAPDLGGDRALRTVVLEDAAAYQRLRRDQPADEFARRIASGAICFAAVLDGRVVGATWARVGGGRCAYLEIDVALPADEVYLFDTIIDPELRGRRIAPTIAAAQIDYFRERGAARIVATVLPENHASLRARARTGFEVRGCVGWVGLGARRRIFVRSLAAYGVRL